MGERLVIECEVCQRRHRCMSMCQHVWDIGRYWARGAEALPCSSFRSDPMIELGYVPRSPGVWWAPEMRRGRC